MSSPGVCWWLLPWWGRAGAGGARARALCGLELLPWCNRGFHPAGEWGWGLRGWSCSPEQAQLVSEGMAIPALLSRWVETDFNPISARF